MTRKRVILAASLLTMGLSACGGDPEQPPVEQIIIRAPGEPAANMTQVASQAEAGGSKADLVAAGQAAFATCSGCHVAEPGAASMAGPNLHGVVGRKAASLDDFAYSDALSGSGITWDIASLDRFLANPAVYVEGTSMAAGAVSDGEQRAAIVAYLGSLSE